MRAQNASTGQIRAQRVHSGTNVTVLSNALGDDPGRHFVRRKVDDKRIVHDSSPQGTRI